MGKIVINFVADMSSSMHVDNKRKDILILGEEPTHGFDVTTLTAEVKKKKKKICIKSTLKWKQQFLIC